MALTHAASGEPRDVRPLGDALAAAKTSALFKAAHLEVIRLVLPAGRALPVHRVAGDITLQCLEGELVVEAHGEVRLKAGELLFIAGGQDHKVTAVQDASALLTIALVAGGAGSERQ